MYWAYLILFILAVFVPDFVKNSTLSIPHERLEELLIFSFGVIGFLIFIFKEHQLVMKESEGKKIVKKLSTATKELEKSYNYIGEVNRKLEMLMQVGLGLINRSKSKTKIEEQEDYNAILSSAVSLFKAKSAALRFVEARSNKTKKEICYLDNCLSIRNEEFLEMGKNINIKKGEAYVIASSSKNIKGMQCYLIVDGCEYLEDSDEGNHNHEILKFLASHALFLYV